jgi:hypothetical protein
MMSVDLLPIAKSLLGPGEMMVGTISQKPALTELGI